MSASDRKERMKKKLKDAEHKATKKVEALRSRVPLTVIGKQERECGECQACCFVIGVKTAPGGEKNNYETCPAQCSIGCAVYTTGRPKECKDYSCAWQEGILTSEEYRPDKLGVIIDTRVIEETGETCLVVWEVRPGAWDEPGVIKLVEWLLKKGYPLMKNLYGEKGSNDRVTGKIFRHTVASLFRKRR